MCIYLPGRVCSLEECHSIFYYLGVDLLDVRETSQFLKELVTSQFLKELSCFLTTTRAEGIDKLSGTTTLAYRIVIKCTTAESVLKFVSTFRLACSSHRQEIEDKGKSRLINSGSEDPS